MVLADISQLCVGMPLISAYELFSERVNMPTFKPENKNLG